MRFFGKLIGISIICSMGFLGYIIQASTGDSTGTGSTTTGNISTGNIQYTGSLLTYLNIQESGINLLLNARYQEVYSLFAKTGLNILKSIEYQSLVCLGAIKDISLLAQMQNEKTKTITDLQKDFVDIKNQILALEEKQKVNLSDGVNLFCSGTTYESEKVRIKTLIDSKILFYQELINSLAIIYTVKNTDFLTTYLQYTTANRVLIKGIQDKMTKVQGVLNAFSGIESAVVSINAKFTGLDELLQKMEYTKIKGLTNLDQTIQPLIDTNIKKYTRLQNFIDELTKQKTYVITQYQADFDEYLAKNFQSRYSLTGYLALKNQVNTFKAKFYNDGQLNCTNILSTDDDSAALLTKINAMKLAINSGLAKIETDGVSTTFQDQLYSGFQSLYVQKFKQRYTEYTSYIRGYVTKFLENIIPISSPTTTGTVSVISAPTTKSTYVFTKPFKSGEYGEGVKALQNLLTTIKFYSGAIDGVYNKATKNAVYQFQLAKGLLKGYAKKPSVWGWMGPSTRRALNQLTK